MSAPLSVWSEERIRDTMKRTNRFFRKTLEIELSWRQHQKWKQRMQNEKLEPSRQGSL